MAAPLCFRTSRAVLDFNKKTPPPPPLPQSPRPVNRPSQYSTPSILTRQKLSIALVASHSLTNTLKGRTLHLPHASKATARHQPWYACCQHRHFSASQALASIHTHMHLYTCTYLPALSLQLLTPTTPQLRPVATTSLILTAHKYPSTLVMLQIMRTHTMVNSYARTL